MTVIRSHKTVPERVADKLTGKAPAFTNHYKCGCGPGSEWRKILDHPGYSDHCPRCHAFIRAHESWEL